jgi:hypothetical protein
MPRRESWLTVAIGNANSSLRLAIMCSLAFNRCLSLFVGKVSKESATELTAGKSRSAGFKSAADAVDG